MEWIIIGAFAFVILCIAVMYFINGRKIKKNSGKSLDKKSDSKAKVEIPKAKDGKVEVESKLTSEKPIETAIKEANQSIGQTDIEKAFDAINKGAESFDATQKLQKGKLKFQREKFKSQIQQSIEEGDVYAERKHLKSETAVIGQEGPTEKKLTNKSEEITPKDVDQEKSIAEQISNLSPEMRAILINDILNNKYNWYWLS